MILVKVNQQIKYHPLNMILVKLNQQIKNHTLNMMWVNTNALKVSMIMNEIY